jgi:putative drug exporter of the RND superfamily
MRLSTVLLVVLMIGLGLDYEIFLVTRVKELIEHGRSDREAVEEAVIKTGRVINFAGLLRAGTLGSMMLSSTLTLQAYGAALGFAVLLDAAILRTYLVLATMILLNKANWWFSLGSSRKPASSLDW